MRPSLDAVRQAAFACIEEGAGDPGSIWHTLTLANVDAAGLPSQRSVVLRGWDFSTRALEIHTDSRSAKYAALMRDPRASLHGWDPGRQVQLRLSGQVALHAGDAVAQAAWDRLRPASRATYGVMPGPGATLQHPADTRQAEENQGYAVFCVIRLFVEELEWLRLEQGSHARARFRWDNGVARSMWLVP